MNNEQNQDPPGMLVRALGDFPSFIGWRAYLLEYRRGGHASIVLMFVDYQPSSTSVDERVWFVDLFHPKSIAVKDSWVVGGMCARRAADLIISEDVSNRIKIEADGFFAYSMLRFGLFTRDTFLIFA